jgi:hypothetical protein
MPITIRRINWQVTSQEDFIFQANDWYRDRWGRDFNDDQIEWMQLIYEEYSDDNGDIDWTHDRDNEAWYYYMSEVLGLDDETIDRYSES